MGKKYIDGQIAHITSGKVPTVNELGECEFGFGLVNGEYRFYGRSNNVITELSMPSELESLVVNGDLDVKTDAYIDGKLTLYGLLEVDSGATFNSDVDVKGQLIVENGISAYECDITIGGGNISVVSEEGVGGTIEGEEIKENGHRVFSGGNRPTMEDIEGALDENNKLLAKWFPDHVLSNLTFGGTIAPNSVATLSSIFKSKYDTTNTSITLTVADAVTYSGTFFIAVGMPNDTIGNLLQGVNVQDVATGDWVISLGDTWVKIDNTDTVKSVNRKMGNVELSINNVEFIAEGINLTYNDSGFTRSNIEQSDPLYMILAKLHKWYTDMSAGLAFKTSVTSYQIPPATASTKGGVIIPTTSGLTVDSNGKVGLKLGSGLKQETDGSISADIAITYRTI